MNILLFSSGIEEAHRLGMDMGQRPRSDLPGGNCHGHFQ